jgi:hypothetical protein
MKGVVFCWFMDSSYQSTLSSVKREDNVPEKDIAIVRKMKQMFRENESQIITACFSSGGRFSPADYSLYQLSKKLGIYDNL